MTWRGAGYRLACRLRRDRHLEILETLRASERWEADRLRAEQEARLEALLRHAAAHVPFYHAVLPAAGVVEAGPAGRVDLTRFSRIPPLTRADIQRQAGALRDGRPPRSGNPRGTVTSSGTTGDPIRVARDWVAYQHSAAVQLRFDEWAGYTLGEPRLLLAGRRPAPRHRFRRRVGAWLRNETRLSPSVLTAPLMDAYLDRINRARPVHVVGWASALYEVARHAEATGRAIAPPRAVISSFEPLAPETRAMIERAFGAPVLNRYGANETGGIACQCPRRRGLHVAPLAHLVEVLRPDGRQCEPGETGAIAVTVLTNYAMPLIRYRIGDLGTLERPGAECPCGRRLLTLADVSGRALDAFRRPDGGLVHGIELRHFYQWVPWVERFQAIQQALDHVQSGSWIGSAPRSRSSPGGETWKPSGPTSVLPSGSPAG